MERCVIIEVGTSYTRGMVIQPNENNTYEIRSICEERNTGVKKSEIVNLEYTNASVRKVIDCLTQESDTTINSVNIIYSGGNLQSETISGTHTINARDQIVEEVDIECATQNAKETKLAGDRSLTEDILLDYILDGSRKVDNPIRMTAASLTINFMRLHVDKNRLDTIFNMLSDNSLDYENVYIAGLCSALGATTPKQREDGVLVINLGGGSTTWTAYIGKKPRCVGSIPIGGDHITNDIHCAFKTTNDIAEKLKQAYGSATIITKKQQLVFDQDFAKKSILLSDLSRVTNARIDETIRIIHEQIVNAGITEALSGGIVLCGGGAALKNITTLVENIFQLPCSIAKPTLPASMVKEDYPTMAYAALLGAAMLCTKQAIEDENIKRSKGFFRKFFGSN